MPDALWRCLQPDCPHGEPQVSPDAYKLADKHTKTEKHATLSWVEPTLPIKVPKT